MKISSRFSENNGDSGPSEGHVWSTWNEERNDEFPQVLEYRSGWKQLGYDVQVTPNTDIRLDVLRLIRETDGEEHLLNVFDNLETTNMQFDFWRYAKLYLDGGIYADVDVKPLSEIQRWQHKAQEFQSVVIFEESPTWFANSTLLQTLRPFVSNFQEFPSYASCIVISPGPRTPFFLDLLRDVKPEQWKDAKEPRKTLMTAGPGLLTRFAKTRSDVIFASQSDAEQAYVHNGFGTWKNSSTLAFEKLKLTPYLVLLIAFLYWLHQRISSTRGNTKDDVLVENKPLSRPGEKETEASLEQRECTIELRRGLLGMAFVYYVNQRISSTRGHAKVGVFVGDEESQSLAMPGERAKESNLVRRNCH